MPEEEPKKKKKKRKKRRTDEDRVEQPPMTPMIDVIFQLMIYFMLTMHFKEVEGKLFSQLPKDKGLAPSPVESPELQEVRIYICAGGNIAEHIHKKGQHEKAKKEAKICHTYVEKNEIGPLHMTELEENKADHNNQIYRHIGQKTAELYNVTPSYRDETKRAPVILDADSEVPMEHIIGVVNACKREGIDNLEFVGNPRFDRYYGSFQKGQFKRD